MRKTEHSSQSVDSSALNIRSVAAIGMSSVETTHTELGEDMFSAFSACNEVGRGLKRRDVLVTRLTISRDA